MASIAECSLSYEDFDRGLDSDPLGTLARVSDEGQVCAIPFDDGDGQGQRRVLVTTEPAVVNAALVHGVRTHRGLLRDLVGNGLFVAASGEDWRRRRDLLHPLFTTRAMSTQNGVIISTVERFVKREISPERGKPVNLAQLMQRLSCQTILSSICPALPEGELAELAEILREAVDYLDRRLFNPESVQDGEDEQFGKRRELIEGFIIQRAGTFGCPASEPGLLAGFAASLTPEALAGQNPRQVLREEILSIFIAGVETMGTLLTWIVYNLAHNPAALRHSLAEARAADLDGLATADSIPQDELAYLRAVAEETLRLTPPAWALFRDMTRPVSAAGVELIPGDEVLAATYTMHHHPALWDDPERFIPERFLGSRPRAQQYLPFGAGPHQCLGLQYSLLEAELTTAVLLRHGVFELVKPEPVTKLRPHIALAPDPDPLAVFVPHEDRRNS
jgi:cytochrome P450